MDSYKKKPLKFSHEKAGRVIRHAETLKIRESSRFERLSILRDINESDFGNESIESGKSNEANKKVEKIPRLELLRKWQQEKILKKQIEAKSKIKPFYAGKNTSSAVILNKSTPSKLKVPSSYSHSKQGTSALKPSSLINKKSGIQTFSERPINAAGGTSSSMANHFKSASRFGIIGSKLPAVKNTNTDSTKSSKVAISSQKPKQVSALPKLTFPKVSSKSLQKPPGSGVTQKPKISEKSQIKTLNPSAVQKFAPSGKVQKKIPTSSIIQMPITSGKIQTKAPTSCFTQKPAACKKTQPQTPTYITQKPTQYGKIQPKESHSQTKAVPVRKGFCFKKAVVNACKAEAENKKNLSTAVLSQKGDKSMETKPSKGESVITQKQTNIPDLTFNCDVSIIKPKHSFAPDDFKFQPPASLAYFQFDDDDDPFAVLEDIKVTYMSRTSTPTKKDSSNPEKVISSATSTPLPNKNSSLKDIQTTNENNPGVSITREILENLSCMSYSVSPKVDCNSNLLKLKEPDSSKKNDSDHDSEKIADEIIKFGDSKDEHMENINEEDSKYSEKLCEKILKTSNDKDSFENEITQQNSIMKNSSELIIENEILRSCDSPFDIVDVSKIDFCEDLTKDEKKNEKVDFFEGSEIPEDVRKSSGISCKKVSIMKMSKLNSIAESLEDDSLTTPSNQCDNIVLTPRRSLRLMKKSQEFITDVGTNYAEEELISNIPLTPRRSLRLQKAALASINEKNGSMLSPCKSKTPKYGIETRRSMKLIDLNTPVKDTIKSASKEFDLVADIERLNLNGTENKDPNAFLIDFENSPHTNFGKSRKVSLLYSPIKSRKSVRKSVRGDLMSFSPTE